MTGPSSRRAQNADIMPLGDTALLVRFASRLEDGANLAALSLAAGLRADPVPGVVEVVPSLVSVLVRYDGERIAVQRLAGEIALRLQGDPRPASPVTHIVEVRFDGEDLADVAAALGMSQDGFVAAHNLEPLRVLTTGFAPGFVYCGMHGDGLVMPRRTAVRPAVPAGSVLFAAGQTAITATEIPTGWHVIGHTDFRNFDPLADPPTLMRAGDLVRFRVTP